MSVGNPQAILSSGRRTLEVNIGERGSDVKVMTPVFESKWTNLRFNEKLPKFSEIPSVKSDSEMGDHCE